VWDPSKSHSPCPLLWNTCPEPPAVGNRFYYTLDGNKNVSEVTGSDGNVVAHYDYAPFGTTISPMGGESALNRWRFCAEYADDDVGLVYFNYRHYDTTTGRWLCRDPLEDIGNQYAYIYAKNDAIGKSDALGLICDDECADGDVEVFVEAKVLPLNMSPQDDDSDGIPFVSNGSTGVSVSADLIQGASWVTGGLAGIADLGKANVDGMIIQMYIEALKQGSMKFSGCRIWTKATVKKCSCESCFFLWHRWAWEENDKGWEECRHGALVIHGGHHVFQYYGAKRMVRDISNCAAERTKKELH